MHHRLLVAAQARTAASPGRRALLQQRLAEPGDVAVPEDAKTSGEEAVLVAVTLDVLRGKESRVACATVSRTVSRRSWLPPGVRRR